MNLRLLRQYIAECLLVENRIDRSFIEHLKNGVGYARGDQNAAAWQIAQDYLEEIELRRGDLLAPGHVTRIERFVVNNWPVVLEQYRGNERLALIAITNMLDAKFNDLK